MANCSLYFFILNFFQITDERATECRIHYIGYPKKWDRWVKKSEIVLQDHHQVLDSTVDSRASEVCRKLQIGIKQKLNSSRKDDPKVVLHLDCDCDAFYQLFGRQQKSSATKRIRIANAVLNDLFEEGWDTRCLNKEGDYCFVTDNTVELSLSKHHPLLEYVKGWDQELHEHRIHRGHFLTFSFVRGDSKNYAGTMNVSL